ncbi:Polyketide cyclase / dehydrase and lipid transport [Actinomadura rubteroloni]|uniref:Polyketide cyclase / dehydrase and lipid transport n=1 Tax=Actinomadura rubteroloni TaxID=1926885 RepID=A0A2P4UQF5_9ACTN|nr:SRPBCC family protein [Actinomadura rubteroloni]POM27291.1 Polyketide cyclase / dehydrase and lipid transport [Actinomadura rubteroloni]
MLYKKPIAVGRVAIDAPAADVYRIISDPPVMITFAEEAYRAHWLDGATGAAVGARFRGHNRKGRRRWYTNCTITEAVRDRRFAYRVDTAFRLPISRWEYDIAPTKDGRGCVVTETNWLRAPLWFIPIAILITGTINRPGANERHIATTLERIKRHLEAPQAA